MKKKHIISIAGDLASGKGTTSKILMERLNFSIYRNGEYFRKLAKEMNMDVTSFNRYVERHPEIDRQIDALIERFSKIPALADKPANMKSQYVTLLKGNKVDDLLCIMKTSFLRNQARRMNNKKVAAIDGEYLMKAEKYLFNEMSVALKIPYEESK